MKILQPLNENLSIYEYENGMKTGTDTVLLSRFAGKGKNRVGVDLGCGSGVLSFLILSAGAAKKITGIEIQEKYAELANENARINNLSVSFSCVNADVRSIREHIKPGSADFVVTNPPYFKNGSGKRSETEESYIARHEVFGTVDDFCAAAAHCLKYGGKLYAVFKPERLCALTYSMKANGIEPKKIEITETSGKPVLVLVEGIKGASEGVALTIRKNIITHTYSE